MTLMRDMSSFMTVMGSRMAARAVAIAHETSTSAASGFKGAMSLCEQRRGPDSMRETATSSGRRRPDPTSAPLPRELALGERPFEALYLATLRHSMRLSS